ncbi:uncharacterized protein LOC131927391 [Physella acuta]|uniref:uncharacterized protein LOC131927391 n=1 Tax=Physella acuta TaxID=109671 RepID=UPI0027DE10FB|nr:uncharacterized protein LOC131927391 [Physella acuta]
MLKNQSPRLKRCKDVAVFLLLATIATFGQATKHADLKWITAFSANNQTSVEGYVFNAIYVDKGRSVTFTCIIRNSTPGLTISIRNEMGNVLGKALNSSLLVATLPITVCNDIGRYSCEVRDLVEGRNESFDLYMMVDGCSDKLCYNEEPIKTVYAAVNDTVDIEICCIANYKHFTGIDIAINGVTFKMNDSGKKFKFNVERNEPSPFHYIVHVIVVDIQRKDYGILRCVVHANPNFPVKYELHLKGIGDECQRGWCKGAEQCLQLQTARATHEQANTTCALYGAQLFNGVLEDQDQRCISDLTNGSLVSVKTFLLNKAFCLFHDIGNSNSSLASCDDHTPYLCQIKYWGMPEEVHFQPITVEEDVEPKQNYLVIGVVAAVSIICLPALSICYLRYRQRESQKLQISEKKLLSESENVDRFKCEDEDQYHTLDDVEHHMYKDLDHGHEYDVTDDSLLQASPDHRDSLASPPPMPPRPQQQQYIELGLVSINKISENISTKSLDLSKKDPIDTTSDSNDNNICNTGKSIEKHAVKITNLKISSNDNEHNTTRIDTANQEQPYSPFVFPSLSIDSGQNGSQTETSMDENQDLTLINTDQDLAGHFNFVDVLNVKVQSKDDITYNEYDSTGLDTLREEHQYFKFQNTQTDNCESQTQNLINQTNTLKSQTQNLNEQTDKLESQTHNSNDQTDKLESQTQNCMRDSVVDVYITPTVSNTDSSEVKGKNNLSQSIANDEMRTDCKDKYNDNQNEYITPVEDFQENETNSGYGYSVWDGANIADQCSGDDNLKTTSQNSNCDESYIDPLFHDYYPEATNNKYLYLDGSTGRPIMESANTSSKSKILQAEANNEGSRHVQDGAHKPNSSHVSGYFEWDGSEAKGTHDSPITEGPSNGERPISGYSEWDGSKLDYSEWDGSNLGYSEWDGSKLG